MSLRAAGYLGLLLALSSTLCAADGEITLCDVTDSLENQDVTLRGRLRFNMDGGAFLEEPCKGSLPGVAVLIPNRFGTPSVNFELDPEDRKRLRPYLQIPGGTILACGAFKGRLVRKHDFYLSKRSYMGMPARMGMRAAQGNGFGDQGVLEWGLIVRSLVEIHACAP